MELLEYEELCENYEKLRHQGGALTVERQQDAYFQALLAKDLDYTIEDSQGPEGQKIKDDIQQDHLKMDIFYQTLNVKSISQSAKYPVSSRDCVKVYIYTGMVK